MWSCSWPHLFSLATSRKPDLSDGSTWRCTTALGCHSWLQFQGYRALGRRHWKPVRPPSLVASPFEGQLSCPQPGSFCPAPRPSVWPLQLALTSHASHLRPNLNQLLVLTWGQMGHLDASLLARLDGRLESRDRPITLIWA